MNGKVLLVALLAAGSAFAGARIALGEIPAADPAAQRFEIAKLSDRPSVLSLTSREGEVAVDRPDVGAQPATLGEQLAPETSLKTGLDGRAALRLGVGSTLYLDPSSELLVEEAPARFVLKSGSARIESRQPGLRAEIRSETGKAAEEDAVDGAGPAQSHVVIAQLERGEALFAVRAGPRFAVLVDEGSQAVTLRSGDEEFPVAAAHSLQLGGGVAAAPAPLNDELRLTLAEPVAEDGVPGLQVTGKTDPLARVRVGDVEADVDEDGAFTAIVTKADSFKVIAWLPGRALIERRIGEDPTAADAPSDAGDPAITDPALTDPEPNEPEPEPEPVEPDVVEPEPVAAAPVDAKPTVKTAAQKQADAERAAKRKAANAAAKAAAGERAAAKAAKRKAARAAAKEAAAKKKAARAEAKKKKKKAKSAKGVTWGSSDSSGGGAVTWGKK